MSQGRAVTFLTFVLNWSPGATKDSSYRGETGEASSQCTAEYHRKPHLVLCAGCSSIFMALIKQQNTPVHLLMQQRMNAHTLTHTLTVGTFLLMRSMTFVGLCVKVTDPQPSLGGGRGGISAEEPGI